MSEDCFKDHREQWDFYLVGQDYDSILERRIQDKQTGLVFDNFNCRLYIKKWSEIINDVEMRMKFLLERLKVERARLSKATTLGEVMNEVLDNSAIVNEEA